VGGVWGGVLLGLGVYGGGGRGGGPGPRKNPSRRQGGNWEFAVVLEGKTESQSLADWRKRGSLCGKNGGDEFWGGENGEKGP